MSHASTASVVPVRCQNRAGFTLVEVLVVVTILALLAALLLPAVQSAREAARRTRCFNNLKQIGVALQSTHDIRGAYPPGLSPWPRGGHGDVVVNWGWGWAVSLLPHLEQSNIHASLNLDVPMMSAAQTTAVRASISVFSCPSEPVHPPGTNYGDVTLPGQSALMTSTQYVGSGGYLVAFRPSPSGSPSFDLEGDGVFSYNRTVSLREITDGSSNTFVVGERSRRAGDAAWLGSPMFGLPICSRDPGDSQSCVSGAFLALARTGGQDVDGFLQGRRTRTTIDPRWAGPDGFSSPHADGCPFLFADGSCRSLKFTVAESVLRALSTRSGGEAIDQGQF